MTELYNKLSNIVSNENVLCDEPMSRHTTFKVGGPASLYVMPKSEDELRLVLEAIKEAGANYYVIGNGSNLLVRDEGYDGVIIEIGKNLSAIEVSGDEIIAKAGALLSSIAAKAKDASLTGLEFASGIPGNLGGAIVMNAGAYDGEMKNVLVSVRLMDENGTIIEEEASRLNLGYRHSNIPDRKLIVLSAKLRLSKGDKDIIISKMEELKQKRLSKHPLEYPSAGSTFKRPEGYFAGKLIQEAGMQGYKVGGAMVSTKHAGFVINTGDATARDIWLLTCDVKEAVLKSSGVILEREIKLI